MDVSVLLQTLGEAFHSSGKALHLVGGSVRDRLLHRPSPDLDFTTDAVPEEIKRITKGTHPDALFTVGEKFGTIGLKYRDHGVEITTYRSEQYQPKSRHPVVQFGRSLTADLARRDFTINAMAIESVAAARWRDDGSTLDANALVDPYGGLTDLRDRVIRAVGTASERFEEDPLRLLRAVRFAAQLGFRIEPITEAAIRGAAGELAHVSLERIAAEFTKILVAPHPAHGIRLCVDLGLMPAIVPEVLEMLRMPSVGRHYKEVFPHTLLVVERIMPATPLLRWTALLHDIAKPRTIGWDGNEVHFRGHERVGEAMAGDILKRLRFDKEMIDRVKRLVRLHLRANSYTSDWTDSALRRFLREIEDDFPAALALCRADVTSGRPQKVEEAHARAADLETRAAELLEREDVAKIASPLDGLELMDIFQRKPGRWIGEIKDYLLDLVLEGELAQDDKETARELALQFDAERAQGHGEAEASR